RHGRAVPRRAAAVDDAAGRSGRQSPDPTAGRRPHARSIAMKLLGTFAEKAPNKLFLSIVLGALAGASYTLIIPLVLSVLAPQSGEFTTVGSEVVEFMSWQVSHYRFALLFVAVCLLILVARTASQVILMRVSMDVTTDLRTTMY